MKSIYSIVIIFICLVTFSCQKEVILPELSSESQESLQYRSGSTVGQGQSADSEDDSSNGTITDPNSDKDESARRKR
jgi:hypothetical protein